MWNADGSGETVLVRGRDGKTPEQRLCGFTNKQFNSDGRLLYFITPGWATSGALHVELRSVPDPMVRGENVGPAVELSLRCDDIDGRSGRRGRELSRQLSNEGRKCIEILGLRLPGVTDREHDVRGRGVGNDTRCRRELRDIHQLGTDLDKMQISEARQIEL